MQNRSDLDQGDQDLIVGEGSQRDWYTNMGGGDSLCPPLSSKDAISARYPPTGLVDGGERILNSMQITATC
jgi:hypothetical protein